VQSPPPQEEDLDDEFEDELDEIDDGYDDATSDAAALRALNDPSTTPLGPAPLVGGSETAVGNLYGRDAMALGRATSPRLWAQASQFPTCSQLRVWRWENGIPVGLGAIDAEANEEDFVREFFEAMPKVGQGRMMFKLRPIDIRGEEMGKELSLVISEHHAALQSIRRAKRAEVEEANQTMNTQQNAPIYMPPMQDDSGAAYASEMSRMFEKAVEAADSRAQALENALLDERERLRMEDDKRAQERIDLATNAAAGVQAITERMMRDESNRAERAMKAQTDQSQMLLTTLTQIFASAQSQQASISETARAADQQRLEQERQYAERVRMEQEERRKRDLAEMEERRRMEQARLEDERKQLRDQREFEMKQLELRAERERQELLTKLERDKAEAAAKLALEERRLEKERQDNESRLQSMREDEQRKAAVERQEIDRRGERERLEWEHRWKLESEERDRRERLAREERERLALLETERRRMEADERERRDRIDREERERRAKLDSDMQALRTAEMERRARAEEDSARLRESERQRAHELALKQMEVAASRDREHAERMLQMQQLQMQEQRATMEARERREKEEASNRDADRLRQHERMLKEVELQAQKDREHAERMMQLTQMQYQQKAFGGLGELIPKAKEWLGDLGLEPADIIQRVFAPEPQGGGGGGGGGWAEAIPKVLGSLAEMGKVAIEAQAAQKVPSRGSQPMPQQPMMMPPGIPGMPPMGGAPFAIPPGASVSPVPGYPGMMAVTMPAGSQTGALVPAGGTALAVPGQSEAPAAEQADMNFDFGTEDTNPTDEVVEDGEAGEQEQAEPEPEPEPEKPSPMAAATEAGLSMATQKRARKAIRTLVRKLGASKREDWFGHIATSIQNEIGIYHYVKAVTVHAALVEGGADETLAQNVMDAMRESGMIPADVEYE
jgi:hypothetical protein